jgi:hypothetical protein
MAEIPKEIKASETSITQEIDLEEWTGVKVSNDPTLMREMQQSIIDYMRGRISEGKGFNERKLKSPYSKTYAASLDFQAAGKSEGDVNMELSGDMVGSIDVLQERDDRFTIGFTDSEVIPRAYGHISGFAGHPNQDALKKYQRVFFGVSKKEFNKNILPAFKGDLESLKRSGATAARVNDRQGRVLDFIRDARDLFDFEDE